MSNLIHDIYLNAVLADSSYIHRNDFENDMITRMTEKQYEFINTNFTEITRQESGEIMDSGFDAVVWQGKTGSAYEGKIYISMRGTESFLADMAGADADLAFSSAARNQIVDMVNWWLRITAEKGTEVPQISEIPKWEYQNDEEAAAEFWETVKNAAESNGTASATGELFGKLGGDTPVYVNGHSLGGHLASAFARIFSGSVLIEDVSTFNSAGFITTSTYVFEYIENALGLGKTEFPPQNNYYGEHGISVTTSDWWFTQVAQRQKIFNEKSSNPIANHYMYKLTDTLALGSALEKLDGSLTLEKFNALLNQYNHSNGAALESMLDAVRKIVLGETVEATPIGDAGDNIASREAFHKNLADFQTSEKFSDLVDLLGFELFNKENIRADGAEGIATRYALQELNPFILTGADYLVFNQNGSLDLYSETNPNGMTEEYLADRLKMLEYKMLFDKLETDYADRLQVNGLLGLPAPLNGDAVYSDHASGLRLDIDGVNPLTSAGHYVAFGNVSDETLEGGDLADRLYGGAGDDLLIGRGGNDHMEGGSGTDTYFIQGQDTVYDSDGSGKIVFSESGAQAAFFANTPEDTPDYWYSTDGEGRRDGKMFAVKNGADLAVFHGQDQVAVKGFFHGAKQNGSALEALGITLAVESAQPADGYDTVYGAGEAGKYNVFYAGSGYSANIVGGHKDDIVFATAAKGLVLNAAGGNDRVFGSYAADRIDGGDGNDWINGSAYVAPAKLNAEMEADKDVIVGGAGSDIIWGVGGDDAIHAGMRGEHLFESGGNARGDWIAGGAGNDKVYGSRVRDFLQGGAGGDTVYGGAGDDVILGDGEIRLSSRLQQISGEPVYTGGYTPMDPIHPLVPWGGGYTAPVYSYGNALTVEHNQANGSWNTLPLYSASLTHPESDQWDFAIDAAQGDYRISNKLPLAGESHRVGQRNADGLQEGAFNDFLYGGAGNDLIIGQDGDDLLHGGSGDDILWGDDNRNPDIAGNDTLIGGTGRNTLIGGKGFDTYLFDSRDLQQTGGGNIITDSDGLGRIAVDGSFLENAAWQAQSAGRWAAKEQGWLLQEESGNLHLSGNGFQTGITVENYRAGMFGLNLPAWLEPAAEEQPRAEPDLPQQNDAAEPDTPAPRKGLYEAPERTWSGGGEDDVLTGTGDREDLNGYGGNDTINGMGGNDVINGGEGDDVLIGGEGADTYVFSGRWGSDTVIGADAEDHIYFKDVRLVEVRLEREERDLVVYKPGGEDQIRIRNQFGLEDWTPKAIVNWEFADGQILKPDEINRHTEGFGNRGAAAETAYAPVAMPTNALNSHLEAATAGA